MTIELFYVCAISIPNILISSLFWALIFSMCFLFPPSPDTEVSKENHSRLNPLLSTIIHSKYAREIQAASGLLSLRLVGIQDQNLEQQLFQEVRDSEEKKGEYYILWKV